jgi:hypothetical protein
VIEQYTITNKYNFPQPSIDSILPHRFFEQSKDSLKQTQHNPLRLNQQIQQLNTTENTCQSLNLKQTPIALKPNHQETLINATDTSVLKIGETQTGIIVAVRGATTWKQHGAYKYTRLGPFVFHITEENKNQLCRNLEGTYFTSTYRTGHQFVPNILQMPMRLAGLLERWLQTMLAKTVHNGVLLFDGSLTCGTPETPIQHLKEILENARRNQSTVLAFSKATTLRANGLLITEQLPNSNPPYLLETTGLHSKPPMMLLGDVYVTKLSRSNLSFRLDIDKGASSEQQIDAVQKLLGNDLYSQSYPETLRLAHILCTFTANEVLAIKHFITRKYGVQMINRPDMHRILFGAYGFKGDA